MGPTADESRAPAAAEPVAAPPASAAAPPAAARPGGVCGVAVGLALVAACVLAFFVPRGGPADGEALLAAWFERDAALPFELAVERAARLPGGVEAVALARPGAPPLAPGTEGRLAAPGGELPTDEEVAAEPPAGGDAAGEPAEEAGPERVDWAAIAPAAEGTPPARVVVIRYPLGRAADVYRAQFERLAWRDIDEIPAEGGKAAVDSGELAWGELSARYVVERRWAPRPEPAFHDLLRVSLATRERFCVLYAVWPPDEVASVEPVEAVLAALTVP